MRPELFVSVAALALVGAASPAFAQDGAQTDTGTAADSSAGDIIVTATRRAEALSDVPIAVSAISGDQLQNSGISDIRALNQAAPSLVVSGATSESSFTARVRGVGTVGENPGLESSVALFIDGVYRSRTGVGLTELGEVERIEVLRGPQGTLFGRNASAGLLNVVTKGPQFDFGGYAAASFGNYDYYRLDGGITGPVIADTLAFRLDGVWQQRDGFIKQVTPGEPDINDRDRWMLRGQMLFEPTSDVSFRLIADYSTRDENCCGAVYQNPIRNLSRNAAGDVVIGRNTLLPLMQALGANIQVAPAGQPFLRQTATTAGFPYRADSEDWGFSGELNWNIGDATLTSITAYRDYTYQQGQDADYNALDLIRREDQERHFQTFTQELRLQGTAFDDRLDWLVGAYYANEKLSLVDDQKFGNDYEKWANCLVVAGNPALAPTLNPARPTCSNAPAAAFPGYQGFAAALGANRMAGTGMVRNTFDQDSRNYAFFTHNVFDIIPDALSLTVGLRYTNERKTLESTVYMNNTLCTALINSPLSVALQTLPCLINATAPALNADDPGTRKSEDEWTGTAVLTFKPSEDLMTYVSYSRGYKSGGFNLDVNAFDRVCNPTFNAACATQRALPAFTVGNGRAEATDLQFASEKVDAYELGVKWDGPGIDINAALFYQAFENFQLNTFNGINFEVNNIQSCKDDLGGADTDASATTGACAPDRLRPGVTSKGLEIEALVSPVEHLSLSSGFTYLDARYRKDLVGTGGRPLTPQLFQLPGRRTYSSAYSMTGAITYTPPISDTLSALVYLDFRYVSDINTGTDIDLEKEQDGYGLINGRLGLYGPDKKWGVEFWGQNLLNTKYQQIAADAPTQGSGTFRGVQTGVSATASQLFVAFPGEPRTYGITVKTKF